MSNPKICPVLLLNAPVHMAKCRGDNCAWWDDLAGACCMASGADYIRDVADALSILILAIQEHEKSPAGAANADEGKVDTSDQTVSTSTITENGGNVK